MNKKLIWGILVVLSAGNLFADNLERKAFSCSRSNFEQASKSVLEREQKRGTYIRSGTTEYDFEIKKAGWHELVIDGGTWPSVILDGQYVTLNVINEPDNRYDKDGTKVKNIYLTPGKHTLKIRSTQFPASQPSRWRLIESVKPSGMIRAEFVGKNINRLHDGITIKVTAGHPGRGLDFEIVGTRAWTGETVTLANVNFGAGVSEKVIKLKFPKEGVWMLRLKEGGKLTRPADLGLGRAALIDTLAIVDRGDVKKELIHDIDCVKLTDMGKKLSLDNGFWEAFGKTRVIHAPFGDYRESGDNLDPNIPMAKNGKSKTGFSFNISVPEVQKDYLVEVEYPDDDRRTVNVIIFNDIPQKRGYFQAALGSGYETGDYYPLSNSMLKHRVLFWPNSKKVTVGIVSMNPGMRSAAAKIKVWKLSGIPGGFSARKDGRIMAAWNEEPGRWIAAMQSDDASKNGGGLMGKDYLGLERMAAMCHYAGYNAINTSEAVYQGAMWNGTALTGWHYIPHDATRIAALFCEKYGLRYIPELHLSAQKHFDTNFPKTVKNPEDIYIHNRLGGYNLGGWISPCWNALHPDIQNKYIEVIRELMNSIGDAESFEGISTRMMTWVGMSWAYLPSLNWGYGDWTIREFELDTGVRVPGKAGDPNRFDARFRFLTSDKMLPAWKKWRTVRLMQFLTKIRDVIRERNPHATLYIPYFGKKLQGMDGPFGTLKANNIKESIEETGINVDAIRNMDGIVMAVSTGGTGRRYSTLLNDFKIHSSVNTASTPRLARGVQVGNHYFEDHQKIPIDKLGIPSAKRGSYCGGAEPGGRLALENYSVPLAEGDQKFFRFGGLAYIYGQPDVFHEWLKEYENLPQDSFTRFEQAVDPVAVWYLKGKKTLFGKDKDFYFYAVNKMPNDVKITLELKNTGRLYSVSSEKITLLHDGRITLNLKPYQLIAFKADANAELVSAQTDVPESVKRTYRTMLSSTDRVKAAAKNGCNQAEYDYLTRQIDTAWNAFQRGQYWSSKAALLDYPMIEIYEKTGCWPEQIIFRKAGRSKLVFAPVQRNTHPEIPLIQEQALLALSKDKLTLMKSELVNPDWRFEKLAVAADGKMNFELKVPAKGKYRLHIGAASPNASAAVIRVNEISTVMQLAKAGQPDQLILPLLTVTNGKIQIEVISPDPKFGIYALRLDPEYKALPSPYWLTAGAFTYVNCNYDKPGLAAALAKDWGPESNPSPSAVYKDVNGKPLKWLYSDKIEGKGIETINVDSGTSFLLRNNVRGMGLCYGLTFIQSPEDRDAVLSVSADWWANLYLNGKMVMHPQKANDPCAQFVTWNPDQAVVHLKKGINTLLVKVGGGTMSTGFCFWISDPGDLTVSPRLIK